MRASRLRLFIPFTLCLLIPAGETNGAGESMSDMPMTRPEEVLAIHKGIGARGYFAQLPDGRVLLGAPNGVFRISDDGGMTWSEPWQSTFSDGLKPSYSYSVLPLSDGALGFIAEQGAPPNRRMVFWRSEDGGKNWKNPVPMTPHPNDLDVIGLIDTAIRTSSRRIIMPVQGSFGLGKDLTEAGRPGWWRMVGGLRDGQWIFNGAHDFDPGFAACYAYYSDDEGKSWKVSEGGKVFIWHGNTSSFYPCEEPSIAEVEPGKLLMLMRTKMGRLFKSWSFDNGTTWSSAMPTQLASSNAPAQVRSIPGTKDLLVVWSQANEEEIRKGFKRVRLSSAVSRSNGAIWEFFQNVDSCIPGSRVPPGPIRFSRPAQTVYSPTLPAVDEDPEFVVELPKNYTLNSYPSVGFYKDRVLIGLSQTYYMRPWGSDQVKDENGKPIPTNAGLLKVMPISWLYGGANNMKETPRYLKEWYPIDPGPAGSKQRPEPK